MTFATSSLRKHTEFQYIRISLSHLFTHFHNAILCWLKVEKNVILMMHLNWWLSDKFCELVSSLSSLFSFVLRFSFCWPQLTCQAAGVCVETIELHWYFLILVCGAVTCETHHQWTVLIGFTVLLLCDWILPGLILVVSWIQCVFSACSAKLVTIKVIENLTVLFGQFYSG